MGSHGTPFGTPPGTPMGLKFFWGAGDTYLHPPNPNKARNMAKTPIFEFLYPPPNLLNYCAVQILPEEIA